MKHWRFDLSVVFAVLNYSWAFSDYRGMAVRWFLLAISWTVCAWLMWRWRDKERLKGDEQ